MQTTEEVLTPFTLFDAYRNFVAHTQ